MKGLTRLTIWRTQANADGDQLVETWTAERDGLTGVELHHSGALLVYVGVDRPPAKALSFGAWSEYTCE